MQGNVELAKMEGSLDQAMPFLETLQGLLTKASGLLRQILAYCGQGKTTMQTLNLNQLVEEMTHLLGTSTSKKARIILNLHPAPLPMAADPSQIQQVVMNLVINASESLGEHNGLIVLATGLEDLSQEAIESLYEGQPLRPGLHVSLLVTDNGSGMTPEVLRRIFDPFFTTKFTGRGLGLAAIHGIVRSHQGGIRVSSEPGKGSTFKVLFPACEDLSFPSPCEPTKPPYSGGRDLGSGLVLVVDDEEAMRSVVATGLDRAGFGTLQARDGQEALQVFQQYREEIRLILMDLTMPTMDGEEAYRELRRQGATIPVILSSGFNEAEALRRFAGLGLAGFLQKPFSLGTLLEMMRTVLPEE
jgi:CheY-like chemotaxis protein